MRSDSQDKLHFNSHCSIKVNSVNERESSQKFPCLYFLLPMGFPDLAKCYRMEPQILVVVGFMYLIQVFLNKVISIQASPNNYRLSLGNCWASQNILYSWKATFSVVQEGHGDATQWTLSVQSAKKGFNKEENSSTLPWPSVYLHTVGITGNRDNNRSWKFLPC